MKGKLFLGIGKHMIAVPRFLIPIFGLIGRTIAKMVGKSIHKAMSKEHHAVRDFVVKELPLIEVPMSSEFISEKLYLPVDRVGKILRKLERMIMLDMNEQGEVTWAYPVTIVKTPHYATLSSSEQIFIPCVFDALAMSFVQGRLRKEPLSAIIQTECVHCSQPLHIELDSMLKYSILEEEAHPLIFIPLVNLRKKHKLF
jgi:Alkylmercury lyase